MTRLYTFEEVADRYNVAICTVRRWAKDGKLTYIKIGGRYRCRETDLEEFEKPINEVQ